MVLGTNHAEIGGQILDKWSFPAELVSAVRWHHDPESCEESCNLSGIVHVANTMGIMTGFGKIDQELALEHFGPVADRLGLAPENLEEMAQQTAARVKKLMVSWG
jgi:HD-like signal output (HDOD) protein